MDELMMTSMKRQFYRMMVEYRKQYSLTVEQMLWILGDSQIGHDRAAKSYLLAELENAMQESKAREPQVG